MSKVSKEEKERLEKLNEMFIYNIGYEHINNICEETDNLLKKYKDIEVPDNLNEWFIKYNKEVSKKEKRRESQKQFFKYSKRVAAVLVVLGITGSVLTMRVEAFRVLFFNIMIETSQKFSLVSQEQNNTSNFIDELPRDWSDYYYPTYLPEGYSLINSSQLNDTKYMTFNNGIGNEIRFIQGKISSEAQIDSENANMIEVEIQGNRGILVEKDKWTIVSWANNDKSFSIQGNVQKSILLQLAESIKKK